MAKPRTETPGKGDKPGKPLTGSGPYKGDVHPAEGPPAHPDVKFERTDVSTPSLVRYLVAFAVVLVVSAAGSLWLGGWLMRRDAAERKAEVFPAMARDQTPPEPRLEALEDLREKKWRLLPPRFEDYAAPQRELLDKGGPNKDVVPIEQAMKAIAKQSKKTGGN